MKNITRKMFMSIITLVLTVVALGTTTFAWFSLGEIATLTGVNADVMVGDGLEIRLHKGTYDSNYKSHLGDAEWGAFMLAEAEKFKFAPVTTTDGVEFNELVQLNGKHLNLAGLTSVNGANKKYLEFNLSFRSTSPGSADLTKLEFGGAAVTWNPTEIEPYDQGVGGATEHAVVTSAANGARIAFLNAAGNAALTVSDIVTNAIFQNDGAAYSDNDETEITGNHASGTTGVTHGQWSYLASKNLKIYKEDEVTQIIDPTEESLAAANELSVINTDEKVVSIALVESGNYYVATITVRIWIEGWDADSYDAIYGSKLTVDMEFNKVAPVGP